MRKPEFLSPSSISTFEKDIEDYAVKYLLKNRPPRPPQTEPMAVGSAFDAYVKSYLYKALMGNFGPNGEYERDTIFEQQVEPHNRDFARQAGQDCFEKYQQWGALADLMTELQTAIGPPRFEFSVQDTIRMDQWYAPLLGKPDCYFINAEGVRVVYDWKVNGYCSHRNTSPMKGYTCCRDGKTRKQHKDAMVVAFKGININCMMFLEDGNKHWADQLSIYSWLLGEEIGSEKVIFGIDQITGPGCSRISSHRLKIQPVYQYRLMERVGQIWSIIDSGHIFRDRSREESDAYLQLLEDTHTKPNEVDDILKEC
jgi:hypothetical protein